MITQDGMLERLQYTAIEGEMNTELDRGNRCSTAAELEGLTT